MNVTVVPQSSCAKQKLNVQIFAWALQVTARGAGAERVLRRPSRRALQSTQHHLEIVEVVGLHELRIYLVATSEVSRSPDCGSAPEAPAWERSVAHAQDHAHLQVLRHRPERKPQIYRTGQ